MMRPARIAIALFGLVVALPAVAGTANACSMGMGYKVPGNLELAAAGEVIVIAEVMSGEPVDDPYESQVLVRPVTLLKGAALPEPLMLSPAYLERDANMTARRSDPRELRAPNPDALIGGCVRYVFAPGMKLVLFLKRDEKRQLVAYRASFSRDSEDIADENALWVKAVREYAAISTAPKSEWKARLKARIAELRAKGDDADAQAIAADMDIELKR